jgi:hypothetical protein
MRMQPVVVGAYEGFNAAHYTTIERRQPLSSRLTTYAA